MKVKCMDHGFNIIVYASVLTFVLCIVSERLGTVPCPPAEENKAYEVLFVSSVKDSDNFSVTIESHDGIIAQCKRNAENCAILSRSYNNLTIQDVNGQLHVNLKINNISREQIKEDEGLYFTAIFKYEKGVEKKQCRPAVYRRAEHIRVNKNVSDEGIRITFSSSRIFPNGKCLWLMTYNENTTNPAFVTESNEHIDGFPTYFITKCSAFLSPKEPGNYSWYLTIYPKLTKHSSDIQYGISSNYSIFIAKPTVSLQNCALTIREGQVGECICERTYQDDMDVFIYWYDSSNQRVFSNQSNVLIYTGKLTFYDRTFYCQGHNLLNWTSERNYYSPKTIYKSVITDFIINGDSKDVIHVKQSNSLRLRCEVESVQINELKILNGHSELSKSNSDSTNFSLEIEYKMTCESFNTFTCLAEEHNKTLTKSVRVFMDCAPQPIVNTTQQGAQELFSKINGNISIIIDLYGYPKPTYYNIIKHKSKYDFVKVTDGNAQGHGYTIKYQEYNSPYGSVLLTFQVEDERDFTDYLFVIDNGGKPTLDYRFIIEEDRPPIDDRTDIFKLVGYCVSGSLVFIPIVIWYIYRRKGQLTKRYNQVDQSLDFHEEILYEDINLNDVDDGNFLIQLIDQNVRPASGAYDFIDETEVVDDDQTSNNDNIRSLTRNIYDMLGEETRAEIGDETNKYKKIVTMFEWETEYITVIDEHLLDENEYITVIDETILDINEYITLIDETVLNENEYITIIDYPEDYKYITVIDEPTLSFRNDIELM